MIVTFFYISIRMAIGHIIGKIQRKGNLEPGLPFLLKKFNRPLFPNRVKLWPKTSDLVFVCPKVLGY